MSSQTWDLKTIQSECSKCTIKMQSTLSDMSSYIDQNLKNSSSIQNEINNKLKLLKDMISTIETNLQISPSNDQEFDQLLDEVNDAKDEEILNDIKCVKTNKTYAVSYSVAKKIMSNPPSTSNEPSDSGNSNPYLDPTITKKFVKTAPLSGSRSRKNACPATLVHAPPTNQLSSDYSPNWKPSPYPQPSSYHNQQTRSRAISCPISQRPLPGLSVTLKCICGKPMIIKNVNNCYKQNEPIHCGKCQLNIFANNTKVYHCTMQGIPVHPHGYNLCMSCGSNRSNQQIPQRNTSRSVFTNNNVEAEKKKLDCIRMSSNFKTRSIFITPQNGKTGFKTINSTDINSIRRRQNSRNLAAPNEHKNDVNDDIKNQFNCDEIGKEVCKLTNKLRSSKDLSTLKWDQRMCDIARIHSQSMAQGAISVGHGGFNIRQMQYSRIKGENVATVSVNKGYRNIAIEAVDMKWKYSKGHFDNLVSDEFTYIGVGVWKNDTHYYLTQLFG